LGQRGNAESAPKLQPLLDDSHNVVRDFASASVIRIAGRSGAAGQPSAGPVAPVTSKKAKKAHP